NMLNLPYETFGHYPPWEFKENSLLRNIYCDIYKEELNQIPKVKAIHAGLECGVFAAGIKDFDCISIGPALYDIHTTSERLSVSSTKKTYNIILKILEKLK
ncbi:MAG: M20/M25/M40 family metallo-hydrolase, partial [Clostridia bacterium]|nr:M20/M25/M40 family metallo-hydrolase [Clostridia bacterium]